MAAKVEYLRLPDTYNKSGLDDFLMSGHTVEDFVLHPVPGNDMARRCGGS